MSRDIWFVILVGGIITFLLRYPLIGFQDRLRLPALVRNALRFVPAAVMPALILPAVLFPEGQLFISLSNHRIIAAVLAGLVAWRSHNVFLTIAVAMCVLYVLQQFF